MPVMELRPALRLLTQATFGPTLTDIGSLGNLGPQAWLQQQFALPPSLHRPAMQTLGESQPMRQAIWWQRALHAPDQLRQRVAFALSQILVLSDVPNNLHGEPYAVAEFYDILVRGAFGRYRDLLRDVTLSPMMGKYLTYLRNAKTDPVSGRTPDENFARELMQLFTIGLWQLHSNGNPMVPQAVTFTRQDIGELARVFTGWNYANATSWWDYRSNWLPMQPNEAFHDQGAKTVLGRAFAANQGARRDLEQALDVLVGHRNCAPFVSRQLIQRLTVSQPSAAYVGRVAAVWVANGGRLDAVVTAILLDPEAQAPGTKVREPLLMQSALWRAFGATSVGGNFRFDRPEDQFAQAALRSPTVFNFFRPEGQPAPECEILTHSVLMNLVNRWYSCLREPEDIRTTQGLLQSLAGAPEVLVEYVDLALRQGNMQPAERALIEAHVRQVPDAATRAADAVYLALASPHALVC